MDGARFVVFLEVLLSDRFDMQSVHRGLKPSLLRKLTRP